MIWSLGNHRTPKTANYWISAAARCLDAKEHVIGEAFSSFKSGTLGRLAARQRSNIGCCAEDSINMRVTSNGNFMRKSAQHEDWFVLWKRCLQKCYHVSVKIPIGFSCALCVFWKKGRITCSKTGKHRGTWYGCSMHCFMLCAI